ncbi:MAG: TonB-dependent receptor [Acidobacteria bacterium]|nr:TonB-dependent receptor [Acidobacteriota bacterium]
MMHRCAGIVVALSVCLAVVAEARQTAVVQGTVRDGAGRVLPGVAVELSTGDTGARTTSTAADGTYRFEHVSSGDAVVRFLLVNFAPVRIQVVVAATGTPPVDAVLQLALDADVTVTGKTSFVNLADVADPTRSLIGIAQSASQGAITSRQLDARPIMRTGEVLETVPGVVISQHSGEGKANQYYLRGFNLDHGTDFATTVAGMPVNLPTHGHGHGYSDLNFLMPELVSGVQFSKGPYYADQGDFATAGAANIVYANSLVRPLARVTWGGQGFGRAMTAASIAAGSGTLLGGVEWQTNDGPWARPDDYGKINGIVRYSRGDALNGLAVTGMGYRGSWYATDQIPARAVDQGVIDRFGTLDPTNGGTSHRYSGSLEWQRTRDNASTKVTAYGIGYDLNLFSNFTYFLDDEDEGDQFEQADHRLVLGGKVSHRRIARLGGRPTQHTVGVQVRHDDIDNVGLYRTAARQRLSTVREDAVRQTSAAVFAQNETAWRPWLRTLAGIRVDGYRFDVDANIRENSGRDTAARVSPKASVTLGPWDGTEVYVNGGFGFHSNDARGSSITVDPATGEPADRVTPLAGARGGEIGVRTVRVPGLQSSLSVWTLHLDSELIFVGDAGTTEAGRPSHRYGVEWANYYSPVPWLTFDADLSASRARFTDADEAGDFVPGAVAMVVSGGATVTNLKQMFGSLRWRYFGPRALIEDNSQRSKATSLVNLDLGYAVRPGLRIALDAFNVFNARNSDIDYFYTSRLRGEPAGGVDDIHFHPTLPRMARLSLMIGF